MATSLGKRRKREEEVLRDPSSHGSTLFVSNLPYNATSIDLQTTFSDLAPVRYAFVVLKHGTGESKGFGYVSFSIREDAQTAFDTASTEGISINGRKLRVRWADKKDKDKSSNSKEERQEENVKLDKGNKGVVVDVKVDEVEDDVAEPSDAEEDEDLLGLHDEDDDDGDDDDDDNDEGDDDEDDISVDKGDLRPTKPQLPQTDEGTTLFIRNIPFEGTEDELRTLFRAFGPLRYALITIDPETERSRGTGFVCFWKKEIADQVIEQSEILRAETTGMQRQPQKNPFTLPSILTPDPSSGVAKNLVLHGRTLDVVRAVTREKAGKLKEEGEKQREKADKRNLYLLREGVILPNTPAASTIPPVEVEKRTNSFNARRTMLRTNPSLYVSKTRLSVRQIPLFATERCLRRLATHAIRTFEEEVKKGERSGLTADELAEDDVKEADDTESSNTKTQNGKRPQGSKTKGVKQAKIVRQQDRVDPVTGKGRSKGYGFIEMPRHADSLRVLRWANNNSAVGPLLSTWWKEELADLVKLEKGREKPDDAMLKRIKDEMESPAKAHKGTLIVEFSIENVQVVQRRAIQHDKPVTRVVKSQGDVSQEPPLKKRRVAGDQKPAKPVKEEPVKPGQHIGSVIGRKRKERKTGSKGGKK
ncbi:hypothetical protein K503DRAFT_773578 [Rhizopogon vinicolor AM-OR11-026]|uniref:RRM domain-containing protein n=1 Tax=Rhizopogon vinicolor AM-OR11-026 TaxID=1314800 RepID=A0A1B7MRV6_9AGAM|nr:hypothetical protein K503DRAFT_773578 [Rhizopogon vinicolor AM-OR11-026]